MGGLGHHASHSYAVETVAFLFSLLVPGGVFALLAGAWWENFRRSGFGRPSDARSTIPAGRFATTND
jgi:hypothetical protein